MKVLIASDDYIQTNYLTQKLSKWGYTLEIAKNSQDATKIFEGDSFPRIAIIDSMLPKRGGLVVCKNIREKDTENYVYTILLTNREEHNLIEGIEAGINDYILKPMSLDELKARLTIVENIITLQDKLTQTRLVAEDANVVKNQFLTTFGEEIIAPINIIIEKSNALSHLAVNENISEYAYPISQEAKHLHEMMQDVLEFVTIETQGRLPHKDEFNLIVPIETTINTLSGKANEKGLKILFQIEKSLPNTVMGDLKRIVAVLTKILENIIKYASTGNIVMQVKQNLLSHKNGNILFEVFNNSMDIPVKYIENDYKTSASVIEENTNREYEGLGLSLATCKKIANLLDGDLWVEKTVGKGSTIYFTTELAMIPVPIRN